MIMQQFRSLETRSAEHAGGKTPQTVSRSSFRRPKSNTIRENESLARVPW